MKSFSHVQCFVTPWTVAYQVPLSMGFSRQDYCTGLLFPSPGNLLNPGIDPGLLHCRQMLLPFEPPGKQDMQSNKQDIMQNSVLDESEAGIDIARRNVNNHRCADDTTHGRK